MSERCDPDYCETCPNIGYVEKLLAQLPFAGVIEDAPNLIDAISLERGWKPLKDGDIMDVNLGGVWYKIRRIAEEKSDKES